MEHTLDEDGEHDEDSCYSCLLNKEVKSDCRCGDCCRRLLIEVLPEDAEREPKIKEFGSPIYQVPRLTASGERELIGYILNKCTDKGHACVFLDDATSLCKIYDTRPLLCRLFNCDGEGREQLIELGIINREKDESDGLPVESSQ